MTTFTATYSPDDNKLRLYASSRLDKELYERVKNQGFRWAPKQELFYAPSWTPGREDLLLELAGEIGDEDTSLVERAEERAERFEDYSDNRTADAEAAKAAVDKIADGIPFGQPILVGHHSEKRARRDAKRIDSGMRKAVKMWETASYWKDRAKGAIRAAKYKERPDVRARRIKTLEAEKRKIERAILDLNRRLALWSSLNGKDNLELALGIANTEHADVKLPNGESYYSAWSALRDNKITVAEVVRQRLENIPKALARQNRWIEHYTNRLEYERAMLDEQLGGNGEGKTHANRFDLKPGGKILNRGEWLVILRVNKAGGVINSVTTTPPSAVHWTSSWKYGVEEIQDYQPPTESMAAKVKKATTLPPICNYPGEGFREMTKAEWGKRHKWSDFSYVSIREQAPTFGKHRVRQMPGPSGKYWEAQTVYITDQKRVDPPKPTELAPPPIPVEREKIGAPSQFARMEASREAARQERLAQEAKDKEFRAMKESLKAGVQTMVVNQLFATPDKIAEQVANAANLKAGMRVLEPSAGTGQLITAAQCAIPGGGGLDITAVEINFQLCEQLRKRYPGIEVHCKNFLEQRSFDLGVFDRILMNPPFENGADIKHVQHAMQFLKPGGRLVAIVANGPRQQTELEAKLATEWTDLPKDSFKDQGTRVNTALCVIDKPLES